MQYEGVSHNFHGQQVCSLPQSPHELDTSMESTSLDLSQQWSYSGQQDHVINFYTSQSDPINRGELGCMSLLDSRLCMWLYKYYNV